MDRHVVGLEEIDRTQVAVVGGKGANLGELSRIDGVRVPAGLLRDDGRLPADRGRGAVDRRWLDRLSRPETGRPGGDPRAQRGGPRGPSRRSPLPDDLVAAIGASLARLGEHAAYAVRSSATAEDLPTRRSRASRTRT